MSGISFSSSASHSGEQVVLDHFPFPVTPEVISALATVDPGLVSGYIKSSFSAYHATLRQASSVAGSSVSGSSVASRRSGSDVSFGKLAKRRHLGARSWRASGVSSETPGYCYLRAFRSVVRDDVAKKLGKSPSFYQLLSHDRSAFDSGALGQLHVSFNSAGQAHIERGLGEFALDHVMRDLASRSRPAVVESSIYHDLVSKGPVSKATPFWASLSVGEGSLSVWLREHSGVQGGIQIPDNVMNLICKSAALLDEDGKRKLRSLEAVGDSSLSALLALDNYLCGGSAQRYQDLRSHVTNNKVLSQRFCAKLPKDSVMFVGGVNPEAGVVGAKALESILGAVWIYAGVDALATVVRTLDLVDFRLRTS
jgi:hypothetical protein